MAKLLEVRLPSNMAMYLVRGRPVIVSDMTTVRVVPDIKLFAMFVVLLTTPVMGLWPTTRSVKAHSSRAVTKLTQQLADPDRRLMTAGGGRWSSLAVDKGSGWVPGSGESLVS
jgi:uncharacterized protein (UPF0261 family)